MRFMRIVDVIPFDHSDESANDSEPSIAVNPNDPRQMVVTAFTPVDVGSTKSRVFTSNDAGEIWTLQQGVDAGASGLGPPSQDWNGTFGSVTNQWYLGLLRVDDPEPNTQMEVWRGSDVTDSSKAAFIRILPTPTVAATHPDQPWTEVITSRDGKDRLYVGYNNNDTTNSAKPQIVYSLDAGAPTPGFVNLSLPIRSGQGCESSIRPTANIDGTVYAAFLPAVPLSPSTRDQVVVVRDDNWGINGFQDLTDDSDNQPGRIIDTIDQPIGDGDERASPELCLRVDPRNSNTVLICYIDPTSRQNTIKVRRSTDRGKTWSNAMVNDTSCFLPALAISSSGTVGLSYVKHLAGPDQWETHFRSSSNGTDWDDVLLSRTKASDNLSQQGFGDYMQMISVGPHFYGVFPATNPMGIGNFFPNGGGTMIYQRNHDATKLLKLDNTPLNTSADLTNSVDAFFFKVEERDVTFQLMRNPISQDEVTSMAQHGPATFPDVLRVIIDGFTANELNLHGPNDSLPISPVPGLSIIGKGNVPDSGSWGNGFQRFTLKYDITVDPAAAFNFAGDNADFTLTMTATDFSGKFQVEGSAVLTLIKSPDPFFLHGDQPWLSIDLRVFSVYAGQQKFSGHPWVVNDASGCTDYIQTVMKFINADDFEHELTTSEDFSRLYTQSTDGLGHEVYNFALAKVHYIGVNPTPFDIRVFFRLFQTQSTTTDYDFAAGQPQNQPAKYRRGVNGDNQAIALAGFQGGEYVTIPFFATERINSEGNSMATQTDPPNHQTITPRADGGEVVKFFGCWLDINRPYRTDKNSGLLTSNNVLPVHVPANNVDGPFLNGAVPIQSLVRATHHCLVAEIDFTPTPTPVGANPFNWDKLAQRNIFYSDAGSATSVATFEVKPTLQTALDQGFAPDDIVIDWGTTRASAPAQIYLPGIDVSDILDLASQSYYPTTNLTRIDDHTLGCRVGGITYIPIPPSTNSAEPETPLVGLISVEMADNLHVGEAFNIIVRQVTNKTHPKRTVPALFDSTIPRSLFSNSDLIVWRQVVGAFQLTIPVKKHSDILPREINDFAFLLYVAQRIPPTSRWYPVFKRYLKVVAGRVATFGGDPSTVLPSATGTVDECDSDDECCECCEQRHRRGCKKFKSCPRHPHGSKPTGVVCSSCYGWMGDA